MRTILSPLACILLTAAATPLPAALKIDPPFPEIKDGRPLTLKAMDGDAVIACDWEVLDQDAGTITRNEQGHGVYQPPAEERWPCLVRVRAVRSGDPEAATETLIKVLGGLPDMVRVVSTGWQDARLEHLAGHEDQAGYAGGKRDAVRFRDLGGVIPVFFHPSPSLNGRWLAADRGNDTIWVVDPERGGWAWPWLGAPPAMGVPRSCKDGKTTEARLQGPSFLAIRPGAGTSGQPWLCFISDTMNQVIRVADEDGLVKTFAGRPGVAGWQDGALAEALFTLPQGLAVDAEGAVYVAEGHSNTIRKLHRGRVTTLAGHPRNKGQKDGLGEQASFVELSGLALDDRTGDLYVCDLHAVRRIDKSGRVVTVAGRLLAQGVPSGKASTGFEGWMSGPVLPEGPTRMAGVDCFNHPVGISICGGQAFIADRDNDALRLLDLDTGALSTLAGHPVSGETKAGARSKIRWGAIRNCRDLLEAPPEARAALRKPFHVAFDGMGSCVVAMGTCLGDLVLQSRERSLELEVAPTQVPTDSWAVPRGRARTVFAGPDLDEPGQESKIPATSGPKLEEPA